MTSLSYSIDNVKKATGGREKEEGCTEVFTPATKKTRIDETELPEDSDRQGKDVVDDDTLVESIVIGLPQAGPGELEQGDVEAARSQAEDQHDEPGIEEMLEPVLILLDYLE